MKIARIERHENVDLRFIAPPSKSYTHRAIICGALSDGMTVLEGPLISGDTIATCDALNLLGIKTGVRDGEIFIKGCGGEFPERMNPLIDCENSGTTFRLMMTLSLLAKSKVTLTGTKRMQERPVGGLADAIRQAGGEIEFLNEDGFPPLAVRGVYSGGTICVDASKSSQYISSLMLPAPYAENPVEIRPMGTIASVPYIRITADVMESFGVRVQEDGLRSISIPKGVYEACRYRVEGDYSSSSYFFSIAAVCGGRVKVDNLNPDTIQGDAVLLQALEHMGCNVTRGTSSVTVEREGSLSGIEIDLSNAPDIIQTLAAVAIFADAPTTITGVSNLIYKESNRVDAIRRIVEGCGAVFNAGRDRIRIVPGKVHGCTIDPEDDHRTAMAGTVAGLGAGDVIIMDRECVVKSFPGFWDELRGAGTWKKE